MTRSVEIRYAPPLLEVDVDRIRLAAARHDWLERQLVAIFAPTVALLEREDWSREHVYELTHEDILRAVKGRM